MVDVAPTYIVRPPMERGVITGDNIIGFTGSTGRSGTMYMSRMLALANSCYTSHEFLVKQVRQGITVEFASATQKGIDAAEEIWQQRSIPTLNSYTDKPYIESDARFLTVAYYYACRDIPHDRLRIIMLYRNKARIALGNCRAGGYHKWHKNNKVNVHTLVYPLGTANITILPKPFDKMSAMELAVWGVFETIERQRRFKEVYPTVPTMDWDMDKDSPSFAKWYDLLGFLGLKMTPRLAKMIKENPKINTTFGKAARFPEHTLEEAEEAVANHKVVFNPNPRPKGFL